MHTISNRRQQADRRQDDIGPPSGWKDRRRSTERRTPTIEEYEVSESEWLMLFGKPPTPGSAG